MRIVQLIDSLDLGGAEKMAVTYANSLVNNAEFSGLVVSRKEGELKKNIHNDVSYLFLNKKKTLDINSVIKLKEYCSSNKIQFIQAHSSSFFLACMVKLIYPKIKIIWHDHYGKFVSKTRDNSLLIRLFSLLFSGVITVSLELEAWSIRNLFCKRVLYLQNYISLKSEIIHQTKLHGTDGKRVIYVANLRPQKNHVMLIDVIKEIHDSYSEWTFHLIGNDNNDAYSISIKNRIKQYQLEEIVFVYGSREDIENCIAQSDIGVFTSISEGLPVALLEFGIQNKPVVSTSVGQIPHLIIHNESGLLSENNSVLEFSKNLSLLLEDEKLRVKFGKNLNNTINEYYSESVVMHKYKTWLANLSK